MLIRCLELEVSLEVHFGLLSQNVGSNQTFHIESFFFLLFFALAYDLVLGLIRKFFKFELFFLVKSAV